MLNKFKFKIQNEIIALFALIIITTVLTLYYILAPNCLLILQEFFLNKYYLNYLLFVKIAQFYFVNKLVKVTVINIKKTNANISFLFLILILILLNIREF